MGRAGSFQTLVPINQTTQPQKPEDLNLHNYRCDNLEISTSECFRTFKFIQLLDLICLERVWPSSRGEEDRIAQS
jgi:hypothetical protein